MTVVDLWVPDHAPASDPHIPPVHHEDQVHSPPVHEPPTPGRPPSVEDRAQALVDNIIAKHLADLCYPLERYEGIVGWRSVLLLAAQKMTAEADAELACLADEGLSARKISAQLGEQGSTLSPSGVEQAVKRARAARGLST